MATKVLTGLSRTTPYLALGGKIKPMEIDAYTQEVFLKPSASDSAVMNACVGTASAGTLTINETDYPRNLKVTFTETGGTVYKGTATVYGKDQFERAVTEVFGCANLGTTSVNGSATYSYVGTVTVAYGTAGTGAVDIKIGYAVAAGTAKLGLLSKVTSASDVKRVKWNDNGTLKPGTAVVDTTYHAVTLGGALSGDDDYIVIYKPRYTGDDNEISTLGTSSLIS